MMPMHNFHRRLLTVLAEPTRAWHPMARVGVLCAVGFAAALFAGCGELEPMREPEVVELELTTDTLKASVRDAQRMVAELRADLEARRGELAEAQVARAQLEGRVREAERRVIEARQVIELQREELAAVRAERARAFRREFSITEPEEAASGSSSHERGTQVLGMKGRRRPHCPSAERCTRARRRCRFPHSEIRPLSFRRRAQTATAPAACDAGADRR